MAKKKIVLAGGTGNIGRLLTFALTQLGYQVLILSRSKNKSSHQDIKYIQWDGETLGAWVEELEDVDTLINLSGQSIQCRFTAENRKALVASRTLPTRALGEALVDLNNPPRLWINFSGISLFEGVNGQHDEESKDYGNTFLANLSKEWEETFVQSITPKTQKVILRLSPVLSRDFGMFRELYPLARFGMGGQVGNGQQQVCWIHELDLVRLVTWIIHHESPAALYHACTPESVPNKEFMQDLRRAVHMPIGIPLPVLFAKVGAFFKGVESDMLLLTNNVQSSRPVNEGFSFNYPTTQQAFEQLTKK